MYFCYNAKTFSTKLKICEYGFLAMRDQVPCLYTPFSSAVTGQNGLYALCIIHIATIQRLFLHYWLVYHTNWPATEL